VGLCDENCVLTTDVVHFGRLPAESPRDDAEHADPDSEPIQAEHADPDSEPIQAEHADPDSEPIQAEHDGVGVKTGEQLERD